MALVSAIIPCYNRSAFLETAIGSIRRQTRQPDEIIVVDDCSTDDSVAVAERLGARVLRTAVNMGEGGARNLGLAHARGELVAWLDADDYWEPEHLELVVPLLERHPTAVLAFGLVREFGDRTTLWPPLLPADAAVDALEACVHRCAVPHMAVVVRRDAVRAIGGYDESLRIAGDYDLWLRLAARHPFACTHAVTANWRQHDGQISRGTGAEAKQYAYWELEYRSRVRLLASCRLEATPARVERLETMIRDTWEQHLTTAWYGRDAAQLRFHLAMATHVPGAASRVAVWRRRARLLPALRAWDAMPRPVRGAVRSVAGRLRAPIAPAV